MKKVQIFMIFAVLLTACGVATYTPEFPLPVQVHPEKVIRPTIPPTFLVPKWIMEPTSISKPCVCICNCDETPTPTEEPPEPTPTLESVRMTIVNYSEYDVYMKLEGSSVTKAFYYLTVPAGTRDEPTVKVFTIMVDLYTRTTWKCNGARSTGTLIVNGNLRLNFSPCGETPAATWEPRG